MYKEHKTWAQFEEEKKNVREKYYESKMNDQFQRIDQDKINKINRRKEKLTETTAINHQLVTQRSQDRLFKVEEELREDKARLQKDQLMA